MTSHSNAQQGTVSWLEWRKQGIGGSDVAAVLGLSPWSSPYQLWLEKTGRKEPFAGNFATKRGQELEPLARAAYELDAGYDFEPCLMTHAEHKFMRVSLDGYNAEIGRILEIKCAGKEDHKLACDGKVPEKYMPQVQYQLYVTGANDAHYYSFDGERGVIVTVYPDMATQMRIATAVKAFWENHVLADVAPALSDKDALEVQDDGSFERYEKLAAQVEELERELEATKIKLIDKYAGLHTRVRGGNVEILSVERKGAVDYSKVPALKDVNLEDYRKPATKYHTVKIV